jgi:serine/threonine-protein kinase
MPSLNGQILQSRYCILRQLGQGGMAAVYMAEDLRLTGRMCAIKENTPDPHASPEALAQLRRQFQAEASILGNLDHPNLPKVSDFFSDSGNEYIVMEYVEGEDLAHALAQHGGPLPEKPVLIWTDQVLDALEYLHSQRPSPIIHRDIKPGNIILTPQGKIKLVDFGLVKLLDPNDPRTATVMKGMGTPEYAPLEQYVSGAGHTDARSDVYSLGATLYHLLTNVAPPDVHQRLLDPTALALQRRLKVTVSPLTETAVMRAIEIMPQARFQTAREFRSALTAARTASQPPMTPAPRPSTATCPACGHANAPEEIYCQECSRPLGRGPVCRVCGSATPQHARYCPKCGNAI